MAKVLHTYIYTLEYMLNLLYVYGLCIIYILFADIFVVSFTTRLEGVIEGLQMRLATFGISHGDGKSIRGGRSLPSPPIMQGLTSTRS